MREWQSWESDMGYLSLESMTTWNHIHFLSFSLATSWETLPCKLRKESALVNLIFLMRDPEQDASYKVDWIPSLVFISRGSLFLSPLEQCIAVTVAHRLVGQCSRLLTSPPSFTYTCISKCGPWIRRMGIIWDVRNAESQVPWDLLNLNLHLNCIPMWFVCTSKFEKHRPACQLSRMRNFSLLRLLVKKSRWVRVGFRCIRGTSPCAHHHCLQCSHPLSQHPSSKWVRNFLDRESYIRIKI